MTTAAAVAAARPQARAVRLVPAGTTASAGTTGSAGSAAPASEDTHDRAAEPDRERARTRPAHCRFALHLED